MSHRSVVIHLHYYQPPREDPWLGEIEREPAAAPTTTGPRAWSAVLSRAGGRPRARRRGAHPPRGRHARADELRLRADAAGVDGATQAPPPTRRCSTPTARAARGSGHGNALAHPYDHAILPLLSRRDKETEVRWGIADFRRRFGREPDGMWLPETAVDDETLDVLAEHGIRFTVVAPHQIGGAPPDGRPGRYRTDGGREIALFAYDGALSREVAFGGAAARRGAAGCELMAGAAPRRRRRDAGARAGRHRRRDVRAPPRVRRDGAGGDARRARRAAARAGRELRELARAAPAASTTLTLVGAERVELLARRRALALATAAAAPTRRRRSAGARRCARRSRAAAGAARALRARGRAAVRRGGRWRRWSARDA